MKKLVAGIQHKFSNSINQAQNMKRFYKQSTFSLNPTSKHPLHKYLIKLDDKVMRTPYRHMLAVPNRTLAFLITSQFNRQGKHMKTSQMPILGLSRTAVDADIQGHLAHHLKDTIIQYLKTDTLNFYEGYYELEYQKIGKPLVKSFADNFNMKIEPSCSLDPPKMEISDDFHSWLNSLTNWQLIGMETMTIWLRSTICAYNMSKINQPTQIQQIQMAATLQEIFQMKQNGEVEEKIMHLNQIRMMANCGLIMFQHGIGDEQ